MLIGRMDRLIELQSYSNKAWTMEAAVWAEFKPPTLKTTELAGNMASELMRKISVRYRTDVRKGWRVLWETRTFEVMHVYEYNNSTTILLCREVVL